MSPESSSSLGRLVKIALGISLLVGLAWFIVAIRGILAPFALAFVLAYLLGPLVDWLEGRGMSRTASVSLIFLLGLGTLGLIVAAAGEPISREIKGLTNGFLQKEMVEKKLLLTNKGIRPQTLELWWEDDRPGQPFSLPDVEEGHLEISPGQVGVLRIRFAPQDTVLAQNVLYLAGAEWMAPVGIRMRGNAADGREEGEESFWKEKCQEKIQVFDLIISASGIDFGRAGPNIFSNISKQARQFQPWFQSYLGEDFDLGNLIAKQGRSLVEEKLLGKTSQVLGGVFSGITFVVLVPFVTFFFLKEGRRITRDLIQLVPNAYFELCLNLLHQINGQIGGYIRGQILEAAAVAMLSIGALLLIGMDYAVPLGLLAGLANVIPFLGPLIGIVSASLVALATGGGLDLVGKVIVSFLLIQIIDNVVVQPTVVARSVEMHPLVVLFVVMVGSQLMGIVGMLIAVPLTGVIKVSILTIYRGLKEFRSE